MLPVKTARAILSSHATLRPSLRSSGCACCQRGVLSGCVHLQVATETRRPSWAASGGGRVRRPHASALRGRRSGVTRAGPRGRRPREARRGLFKPAGARLAAPAERREKGEVGPRQVVRDRVGGGREHGRDRLPRPVHALHVRRVAWDLHDRVVGAREDGVEVGHGPALHRQQQRHHPRHRIVPARAAERGRAADARNGASSAMTKAEAAASPVEEDGAQVCDVQPAVDDLGAVAPRRDLALLLG